MVSILVNSNKISWNGVYSIFTDRVRGNRIVLFIRWLSSLSVLCGPILVLSMDVCSFYIHLMDSHIPYCYCYTRKKLRIVAILEIVCHLYGHIYHYYQMVLKLAYVPWPPYSYAISKMLV